MTKRTLIAALYLLLIPLVLMTAFAQQGAEIEGVEVGIMNGTVGLVGNSVLYVGDGSDDAIRVESGVGDDIVLSVDAGTDVMSISGMQSAAGVAGIVSLQHQSRTRWFLSVAQNIPPGIWVGVPFDRIHFDEHLESTAGVPSNSFPPPAVPWTFVTTVAGYYQVNARTEFDFTSLEPVAGSYVSIAIYVNTTVHSQGNNLQIVDSGGDSLRQNNAPNVSDVVYLQAGDVVEIRVYQGTGALAPLVVGSEKTYVSLHRLS